MSQALYAEQINIIKTQINTVKKELNHLLTELSDAVQMEYDAYIEYQRLASIEAPSPRRDVGTKLVWTSDTNPDTYCEAIVVKDLKIIQMKCVTRSEERR